MQKTIKFVATAGIWIVTAIGVTVPAGSGAAESADPIAVALEPCPLPFPMQPHQATLVWAEGWQRNTVHTRSGLVLQTRVPLPPAADTGFRCPIARTMS